MKVILYGMVGMFLVLLVASMLTGIVFTGCLAQDYAIKWGWSYYVSRAWFPSVIVLSEIGFLCGVATYLFQKSGGAK